MSTNPVDILKNAREYVARNWMSGSLYRYNDGAVCALGAIAVASGWNPEDGSDSGYNHLELNGQAEAVEILASVVDPDNPDKQHAVYRFNDRLRQTREGVVAAFDDAIAAAEAKYPKRPWYLFWKRS